MTPEAPPRGPIAWMATNPVAANICLLILIAGGFLALLQTKQEVFPEFALDLINVSVAYPGAGPEEVEQAIALAVEEAVRGIDGVKEVRSNSAEGFAAVSIELVRGADADRVLADVKSATDRIRSFPKEAERPVVSLAIRRREVISLVIAGEQEPGTLHALGEKVRAELLALPGITQVELVGVRPVEISVSVRREKLEAYGLTLEEVARQVGAASIELPGGSVRTSGGELLLRLSQRRKAGHEFEDVILRGTASGALVRLGDVAEIVDGYAETDQASYYDGKPAVRVTVYRVGEETPKAVAATTRAYLERLRAELPENVGLAVWNDDSVGLQSRIDLLLDNAVLGFVLVFLSLAMFLRLRVAGWVALGIPASFLGAFLLLPGFDASINMITLFAFIVVLGMVVDDAIVVGEKIDALVDEGLPRMQTAIAGARRMAVPVTFSVLTTMVAFAPLFFVPGTMGKIFKMIPVVVVATLAISLFESFFILPAHLGQGRERAFGKLLSGAGRFQRFFVHGLRWFGERVYRPVLVRAIEYRQVTIALCVAALVLTASLVASGHVPFNFFPRLESDVVTASVRLPYGSPIERNHLVRVALERSARAAVAEAGGDGLVRGMFTRVGEGAGGSQEREIGAHLITVEINLVPSDEREVGANRLAELWTRHMPRMAGVESQTISAAGGPRAGKPVDLQLSHRDVGQLALASEELAAVLRDYPALRDVDNAYGRGKVQLDFKLLPTARSLGLTAQEVARQLRSGFYGAEAIREQRGRDELTVMVKLPLSQRRSEYDIEGMLITTPAGGKVPLSHVAAFERGRAPSSIKRENGRRTLNVGAELSAGTRSAKPVLENLEAEVLPALKARYPGLEVTMVGQERERAESFAALGRNFIFALLLMYVLLAIPLKSYAQPLLIMSAIPFGFVGAVGGHVLMGYDLSLMSVFGIIALSGVVVNDSLVLIDAVNEKRAAGLPAREAIIQAGLARLRPVLLTSATTFLGLAPILLERSMQARYLIPMAVSLAFGVLFATAIILVLVPALYLVVEREPAASPAEGSQARPAG